MARHFNIDKKSIAMQEVVLLVVLVHLPTLVAQSNYKTGSQYKVIYKEIPDNRGKEFVVGFMQQFLKRPGGAIRLFLTSDYNTRVVIEIPEVYYKVTVDIKARELQSVDVANTLRMHGTAVEKKGILIRADSEIVVYGLNILKYSTDAFLALPVDIQSKKYIIPSFTPNQNSLIGIIGIYDKTTVFVTFRFAKKGSFFQFKRKSYFHKDTLAITLNKLETFQIAHSSDMTGTRIISTEPISVFSGNECAEVPSKTGFCDHLVEHIPPVNTWGTRFVTIPLLGRRKGDIFRILAANDTTNVRINGKHVKTLNEGKFLEVDVPSNQYQFIETSKPCLVLQFSKGAKADNTRTDPFMVMIPPIEQYTAQYTVSTPDQSKQYFNSCINVVIETRHIDGLRLDGRSLRDEKWVPVWGTDHSAAQLRVSHGVHRVMHDSPIVPFAIFLYGFYRADSYGYPGGLRLADLTVECVPGNPGDGLDNDCDRRIDEEIKNYIDDDNDGRVDEDLVTEPPRFELDAQTVLRTGCPSEVKKLLKEPIIRSAPLCTSRGPNKLSFIDDVIEKNCVQYISRMWLVRDGCGNLANITQDIRISRPTFEVTFPSDIRGKCARGDDLAVTGEPEVISKCDGDVFSVKYRDRPSLKQCTNKGREVFREWTVKASCDSVIKHVQKLLPDLTPPKINFIGKLQYQVKSDFKIKWKANEKSRFECSLDNPNNPLPCGKGLGESFSKKDIPDGKHTFWVRATDLAGNKGGFIKHSFTVDKIGPRLRFIRPLGTLSRASMIMQWRSTELSRFKCGLDRNRLEQCGSGWKGRKYLNKLRDGVHRFYVGARDKLGNEADIISHVFVIDSTPPRIKFGKSLPPNVNSRVDLPIMSNERAKFYCALDNIADYKPCGKGLKGRFVAKDLKEGPHVLYVKASDPAGNTADPIFLSWNSDKTSPNIVFTPGLPTKFQRNPKISWTSTEYAKFECALNDASRLSPCGEGTQKEWQRNGIEDGQHTFHVRGTDNHGNVGPLASFRFTIDSRPPIVRLSRTPKKSSSKTMTFRWTSDEMAYYHCAVDKRSNLRPCGRGTDGEWTTPLLSDGNHLFFLTSKDELGNKAPEQRHGWKIDSSAPRLRFYGKLPDSSNQNRQKFNWISSEYATFKCSIDSGMFKECYNGKRGSWTAENLDDGSHIFRVKGVDNHGNEGPVLEHTWNIDTKSPLVTLGKVPRTYNKPKAKFTWDASEPSKFRCSVDGDVKGVKCGTGKDGEFLTPTLADGEHEFRLLVEDMVGNLAPLIRSKFDIDTTSPAITFNKRSSRKPKKQINVSWKSSEESEFECALDDPTQYQKCGRGIKGVFLKEDLPDGDHRLYVRGRDKVGNVGNPSIFSVTTDNTAPTVKLTDRVSPLSKKPLTIFKWISNEKATFKCKVDDRKETICGLEQTAGQFQTPILPDGEHVFQVSAIDQVGNKGKTMETKWIIDSSYPIIRYTNQPPKVSRDQVTFKWISSESALFECVLGNANPEPCGRGNGGEKVLANLPKGRQVFRVRGTDKAGNVGSYVPHLWFVDTNPPRIQFTGDLPSFSNETLVFKWKSDENSDFECALDRLANFFPCGNGTEGEWKQTNLPEGRRTFYVRAKDNLNNVGKPISHSWVVDSTPPRAVLAPVNRVTGNPRMTLSWRSNERSKFFCAIGDVGNVIECGQGTTGSWTTPYLRQGPQKFWLIAEDDTGNRAKPVSVEWTVDNDAPTVTFSGNSTKKGVTSEPKFSWTSDEHATFQCAIQGVTSFQNCGEGASGSWTSSDVPDGKHNFLVRARDKFGNEKKPFSFPFEIDTTPPTGFSIVAPPKRTNKPQARFEWKTSEDSKFSCYLDDQTDPSDCGVGRNGQYTTKPLPDGDHHFKVVATDDLGNKAPVVDSKWTIDTKGPSITFAKDLPKTTLNNPRFNWKSDEPVARFECSLDNQQSWDSCGSGTTGTWQGSTLPDGKHTLFVRGQDDLRNIGKPSAHRFTVDNTAPRISIATHADRKSPNPVIKWISTEDISYECSLDDSSFVPCGKGKTGIWTNSIDDGRHKLVIRGEDTVGNYARFTYSWDTDTTPPIATLVGELPTDSNNPVLIFSWKSDEYARFTCTIQTGNVTSKAVPCSSGNYGQFATPLLPDGKHTFILNLKDALGNDGKPLNHTWRKDSSPPQVKVNPDTSVYNSPNPTFTWTSSEDATFECAIDDTRLYEDCGKGFNGTFTAKEIPSGRHMFFVRAKDRVNNYGPHIQYPFRVDTLAPRVYLTNGIPPKIKKPRVTIGWRASENSNFECILDGKPVNCGSGSQGRYTTPDLPHGKHSFSLNTVDNVGNKGPPITVNWETDLKAPEIIFDADLPKKTTGNPQIRWSSSEWSTYECAVDSKNQKIACGAGTSFQWVGNNVPKGPHTLWVRGTDRVGNKGEWKGHTFDVDTSGPEIFFPRDQPKFTNHSPTFTWTSSEHAKFKCGIDYASNLRDCGEGKDGKWTSKDIPDGQHVFVVYGIDEMGNVGDYKQHPFTVDNKSPVIVFPQLPDTTGPSPRFPWLSTEYAHFECSVDGAVYKSCGKGNNGEWLGKNLSHGRHVLSVRGKDNNGNVGEPTRHIWNVDTSGPKITFSEPFPTKTSRSMSRVFWTADEYSSFRCAVDNIKRSVWCGRGKNGQFLTPRVPDGEHTFFITGVDNFGNKGPVISRKWLVDSKPPDVKVNPDSSVYNTSNPTFMWTSSEKATFECAIDDTGLYQDCGEGLTGKFVARNVPSGQHIFFVRAKDHVNNYGSHVQYPFRVDTQAPVVYLTNGVPPKTRRSSVTFGWTSSEDAKYECLLNGKPVRCGSGRRSSYTTPDLSDGKHTFSLNTVDNVGNKGIPKVITWEIDSNPPKVKVNPDFSVYNTSNPIFTFTSSEEATFECAVDNTRLYQKCGDGFSGMFTANNVPDGQHMFFVQGKDKFDNYGPHIQKII